MGRYNVMIGSKLIQLPSFEFGTASLHSIKSPIRSSAVSLLATKATYSPARSCTERPSSS